MKLIEEGSRTVLGMENQHLRLIVIKFTVYSVERALERSPEIDDLNDT